MTSIGTPALWTGFIALVLLFLALDLGLFHRKDEPTSTRNALTWTAVWVTLALAFNALVAHWFGGARAAEFLTGYLIEKSLSVDNLFVFLVIFTTLAIPPRLQHRVLFWGILTALVLLFIGAKMLVAPWLAIGQGASLVVVVVLLAGAVAASVIWPVQAKAGEQAPRSES